MHAHTRFQRGPGEGCVAEPLANGECEGALLHLASDSHNIKCVSKRTGAEQMEYVMSLVHAPGPE